MAPARYDFKIWRGNSKAFPLRFKTKIGAINLTGSTLVFRAVWPEGELRKEGESEGFAITAAQSGEATLSFAVAETRGLPIGKTAKYEIERRIGSNQETVLFGFLEVADWANDD